MTGTIKAATRGRRLEVEGPADSPEGAEVEVHSPAEPDIQQRFRELVAEWKQATRFLSSIHDMVTHPAYLEIMSGYDEGQRVAEVARSGWLGHRAVAWRSPAIVASVQTRDGDGLRSSE